MGKITINEIHKSLFDYVQAVSDDRLETRNKTIVGAINELISNNNNDTELNNLINEISNGKQLIANAIGEPLTAEDSFNEMSTDINSLLSTFKTNMMNNGVSVASNDKFKQLIDKLATMVEEGSGKGIRYASEAINVLFKQDDALGGGAPFKLTLAELDFEPSIVFIETEDYDNNFIVISSTYHTDIDPGYLGVKTAPYAIINTTATSKQLYISMVLNGNKIDIDYRTSFSPLNYNLPITYYAIGVGEEDTTIESSIISILKTKGYDESKDNIIDFIENKLYTKVIEPGTNVTIATGEGLESRRSENNQLFTKSLIVPSLSNLGSDNIKGLSLKVVSWAYHDDLYGPEQYSMSDGYFRIQIKRDGVVINNAFESSTYTYNYNNGNGTTHAYDLLDVQEGDVIEYTVGYYASGFLGTNTHEYHFGVKGAYLTYSIGYVTSL